jgi:hypothetical protein
MQNLKITDAVAKKLKDKHGVDRTEVEHCFVNRLGRLLEDKRARHKTNPPTLWFLSKTNKRAHIEDCVYTERPKNQSKVCLRAERR